MCVQKDKAHTACVSISVPISSTKCVAHTQYSVQLDVGVIQLHSEKIIYTLID